MSDIAPEPQPADPAATEPVEPAWTGPSADEWQQVVGAVTQFGELISAAEAAANQGVPPQLNPWEDDFETRLEQWYERKTAPIHQELAHYRSQEGDARAEDILHDLQQSHDKGEFLFPESAKHAKDISENVFRNHVAANPNLRPRDVQAAAEAALSYAYEMVRDWEDAVGKAYYEREINQLKTLSGARVPPTPRPGPGATPQQVVVPEGGDEISLVAHYLGR